MLNMSEEKTLLQAIFNISDTQQLQQSIIDYCEGNLAVSDIYTKDQILEAVSDYKIEELVDHDDMRNFVAKEFDPENVYPFDKLRDWASNQELGAIFSKSDLIEWAIDHGVYRNE